MPNLDGPANPSARPRGTRRASRILVMDRDGAVLLFRDSDLGLDPVPHWWITPGGGVDPGESDLDAAVRELREETGAVASPGDFIGPVATRTVLHGFSDHVTEQVEVFFALVVDRFTPDGSEQTEEERACFVDHGWFSTEDLSRGVEPTTGEPVWPADIRALCEYAEALAQDPHLPSLDLPGVEESTVPADQPA